MEEENGGLMNGMMSSRRMTVMMDDDDEEGEAQDEDNVDEYVQQIVTFMTVGSYLTLYYFNLSCQVGCVAPFVQLHQSVYSLD